MRKRCNHTAGFTLIEMLVVVLIIGILVALLSTAYSAVVRHSRQVKCLTHLKDIGTALQQYANNYDQSFPPLYPATLPVLPDAATPADLTSIWGAPGRIMETFLPGGSDIWKCPTDRLNPRPGGAYWQTYSASYGYNPYLGLDSTGLPAGVPSDAIRRPDTCALAFELCFWDTYQNIPATGSLSPPYSWHSGGGSVGKAKANVVFADQHAAFVFASPPDNWYWWLDPARE